MTVPVAISRQSPAIARVCEHPVMAEQTEAAARLDARLREARNRLERLEGRVDSNAEQPAGQVQRPAMEPAPADSGGYVLFVPSPAGYTLVEREGSAPGPGETVTLAEREETFVVTRLAASPRPGDRRPCAFLQPA